MIKHEQSTRHRHSVNKVRLESLYSGVPDRGSGDRTKARSERRAVNHIGTHDEYMDLEGNMVSHDHDHVRSHCGDSCAYHRWFEPRGAP
jgi:hypothetical protein